jgi:hypothetical protein
MLLGVARAVLGDEPLPRVVADLQRIAVSPAPTAAIIRQRFLHARSKSPDDAQRRALVAEVGFDVFLRRFSQNFALVTTLKASVGDRRILKFSYDVDFDRPVRVLTAGRRRWSLALGWSPRTLLLPAAAMVDAQSYHFEASVPGGIELLDLALWAQVGVSRRWSLMDWKVGPRARLHVRASSSGDERDARVTARIRASRRGWLSVSTLAACVVFIVLTLGALRFDAVATNVDNLLGAGATTVGGVPSPPRTGVTSTSIASADDVTGRRASLNLATTFFLAITGIVGALLIRAEEHLLVTRLLRGLRMVARLSALLPFVAVGTLVFVTSGPLLHALWALLAGLSAVCLGALLFAFWRLPVPTKPPSPP